jgi:ribose 5-phosphate isomerase B
MNIALGTDHGGFALKKAMAEAITKAGHRVIDCGASSMDPDDDYPVFAERVARAVSSGEASRGVVLCGSGVGASVAANKVRGVRAALCHDTFSAHQGVEDDDMNVLCIGARVVGPSLAAELVTTFLGAKFSGAERHRRRLEMVKAIEAKNSP